VNDDCLALSVFLAERRRVGGRFVSDVLLELYERRGVAASVVLRGIGGFGTGGPVRSDASLSLSMDLPVEIVAVDTRTRIEELIEPVLAVKQRGLVTLERSRLLSGALKLPEELPEDLREAVKMTIYVGRKDRIGGMPAHVALCDLMHRRRIAGASVFLGVDGTLHGHRERARFVGRNANVPMMVVAVGSGESIGRILPEITGLLPRPMITLERVRVCKRGGELLERPHELPALDERGLPLWQKLTVYTRESALTDGVPIHRALLQQLRRRTAADGATALRGIWGFHGDHLPHGDVWWSVVRRVPVVTVIIDTPANIAESFAVVDELTRGEGLVTCEMVPALVSDDGDAGQQPRLARYRY
jgi:PII-like signaling protein